MFMAELDQLHRTLRNCLNLWAHIVGRATGKVSKPVSNTQQVRYIPSLLFGHESLFLSLSVFKPRSSRRIPLISLLVSCRSCEDVANIKQLYILYIYNMWVHGDKWVRSIVSLERSRTVTFALKSIRAIYIYLRQYKSTSPAIWRSFLLF